MKPIHDKLTDPLKQDDLNKRVLGAAAVLTHVEITTDIAIWGVTTDTVNRRVEPAPAKNGTPVEEQPVTAGNDEASLTQRHATAAAKQAKV